MEGVLICLAFLVPGVLAYTGRWRSWLRLRHAFGRSVGFSPLYMGLGWVAMTAAPAIDSSRGPVFDAVLQVGFVMNVVGIVAVWWLPPFLLPKWLPEHLARIEGRSSSLTATRESRVRVGTPHLWLPHPREFEEVEMPGADLVLRQASRVRGFRPNLVFTSVESDAPLVDASWTAMLAAPAQHPGAVVIACEIWMVPDRPTGRCITFAYPTDVGAVVVLKWVWATGEHHVHISASCSMSQYAAYLPYFEAVVSTVRFTASSAAMETARTATRTGGAPIDRAAQSRGDFPLEELRAFPRPVTSGERDTVSAMSLEALAAAVPARRLEDATDPARIAPLVRAGWVDDEGWLTPAGRQVGGVLAGPPSVTVRVRQAGAEQVLHVYAAFDVSAVVHPPVDAAPGRTAQEQHIVAVPNEQVPIFIARWLGLTPRWPYVDGDGTIVEAELAAHLDGTPGVEPWGDVRITGAGAEQYDIISPTRGLLLVGPLEHGRHSLMPHPTAFFFEHIVRICGLTFAG